MSSDTVSTLNLDSDNESSNASTGSNESQPRAKRNLSRLAKKSTTQAPVQVIKESKHAAVTRRQAAMANKEKNRFLDNFNPETSARERRKLDKKIQGNKWKVGLVNDNKGVHINSGRDLCDCLEVNCPGCFFPCKKCNSPKCGVECRVNRKTRYESIEYHGYNYVKSNPLDK